MRSPLPLLLAALACGSLLAHAAPELISVDEHGSVQQGQSNHPSISADGRYVAFASTARLASTDRNTISDVYVRDRAAKTTRRVSDDRGGDQPFISANGRFVVFRALDGLTRARLVDLEHAGIPIAAAIPTEPSNYDRPSDSAVIAPDGAFAAFANRTTQNLVAPNDQLRGNQVMLNNLLSAVHFSTRLAPASGPSPSFGDLGRIGMSFDGNIVVFDSKTALTNDDTNTDSDVYVAYQSPPGSDPVVRISVPQSGNAPGGSRQPVIAQDGSRVFFLSDAVLDPSDTDGRTTIYLAQNTGSGFSAPVPLVTSEPMALSLQATITGSKLAFLARKGGVPRLIVLDVGTSVETVVPIAPIFPESAPALSGNGQVLAFSSHTGGSAQVYVAQLSATPAQAPAVTLTSTSFDGTDFVVTEGSACTLNGAATPPAGGSLQLLSLEVDAKEDQNARVVGSFGAFIRNLTLPRGIYRVRARAFSGEWVEGVSPEYRLVVRPPAGTLAITGVQSLTRSDDSARPDGRVEFSGTLRIDNRRGGVNFTGPLRVILTDAPTEAVMTTTYPYLVTSPPDGDILAVIDVGTMKPNTTKYVEVTGLTGPTSRNPDNSFYGWSHRVIANLREGTNGNFTSPENPAHPIVVLEALPKLDENTNLPNGGVPVSGSSQSDANFTPNTLDSLEVKGRAAVGGPARAAYNATGHFNSADRTCIPKWSLVNAAGLATIGADGVLHVGALSAPRNVTIHAEFFGKTADLPVTVFPLPPLVMVRALPAILSEPSGAGTFRFIRIGAKGQDLAVQYGIAGTAQNGTDYQGLSGTATIPAGLAVIDVPVTPTDDGELEGNESIALTLLPDPAYRLGGARTARLVLHDDEPIMDDQPDLVLRLGAGTPVGTLMFQAGDEAPKQALSATGTLNHQVNVVAQVVNRGTNPQVFTILGGPDTLGFTVKYLFAGADVTNAVIAGTFALPELTPGAAAQIVVSLTPTADAPVGGMAEVLLRASSAGGRSDFAGINIRRGR
jgi:Tol biopolymer transport system component